MKYYPIVLLCCVLLSTGCVTNDPHSGGLIGYIATGEDGYQKRVDERAQRLGEVEGMSVEEEAKAGRLATDRDSLRAKVREQREQLNDLQSRVEALQTQCAALESEGLAVTDQKEALESELAVMASRIQSVNGDSSMLISEKEQQIDALNQEVGLLLERYSLLTTL